MNIGNTVSVQGKFGKVSYVSFSDETETVEFVSDGKQFRITGPAYQIVRVKFLDGTVGSFRCSDVSLKYEHKRAA